MDSSAPICDDPRMDAQRKVESYASGVESGRVVCGRWIYAAMRRWARDLEREDLRMDWAVVDAIDDHFRTLNLVGDDSNTPFELHPWQLWIIANLWGWHYAIDKRRRTRIGIVQVARGNGKTTLMAGLALWDLFSGEGKRVHVIANNEEQAAICLDTARTMIRRQKRTEVSVLWDRIEHKDADCIMTALPALPRALDGLNPSMWIADEMAEFKGRHLTKLLSAMGKRREVLGVIISTPSSNPENHYSEMVSTAQSILQGEIEDDSIFAALYGLDPADALDDTGAWPKANPGMLHGQPDQVALTRSWTTMKRSPMGRSEFARYHAARMDENTGGWLDMSLWPGNKSIDWAALKGRAAWVGLDLSKSLDMTALVVAVPLEDGTVALRGHYWWPMEDLHKRELDYRMPVRTWASERKITLTPGREVDYESVRTCLNSLRDEFDLRVVGYDSWGSKYLVEMCEADGIPMTAYRMGISTFGPGCQLWQNLWAGGKLIIGDDPILRRSCAEAQAQQDRNGNVRPVKSRNYCILDPLVASIIAMHTWGGKQASCYEQT